MPPPRKCIAFTLAEVLITLGIIGVVALITLPSVINDVKGKKLETQLRKSYSILSQALTNTENELGYSLTYNTVHGNSIFRNTFIKQFPDAYDCRKEKSGTCLSKNSRPEEYKTYTGQEIYTLRFDDGNFRLKDGTFIIIECGDGRFELTVDINGKNNKPNKWGHDLFTFQITDDGKFLPMGADSTRTNLCDKRSPHSENGVGCTYKALNDKDYWKNLPH